MKRLLLNAQRRGSNRHKDTPMINQLLLLLFLFHMTMAVIDL
jgi:hypothetical protein